MIVVLHSDHGSSNNIFRNFQVELYDVRAIASSVFRVGNLLQYILQKLFYMAQVFMSRKLFVHETFPIWALWIIILYSLNDDSL